MPKQDRWLDGFAAVIVRVVYFVVGFVGTLAAELHFLVMEDVGLWVAIGIAVAAGIGAAIVGPTLYSWESGKVSTLGAVRALDKRKRPK